MYFYYFIILVILNEIKLIVLRIHYAGKKMKYQIGPNVEVIGNEPSLIESYYAATMIYKEC